jgi:hypothetical protein
MLNRGCSKTQRAAAGQEDTGEMDWSALADRVIGVSIPALLALETLAYKPRRPGPARTGEDWAARQ